MPRQPNPTDIDVGRRIRIRRMQLGMSQTDLGDRLNVTFQQIQKYEKGANRVGAGRLNDIASLLDVPVSYFFGGTEEKSVQAQSDALELLQTSLALRLAKAFSRIADKNIQYALVTLAENIADTATASSSARR